MYGRDPILVVHSTFDELCNGRYESLLINNPANDRVHERGRVDEAAPRCLKIGVQMPLSVFQNIET